MFTDTSDFYAATVRAFSARLSAFHGDFVQATFHLDDPNHSRRARSRIVQLFSLAIRYLGRVI